jgi:hypothetical protein
MPVPSAAAVRAGRSRPRPVETYQLLRSDHATVLYVLRGREAFRYVVEEIATEIGGRAFRLSKQWGVEVEAVYHVRLSAEGDTCDCAVGCYTGHCKHIHSLAHFLANGELSGGAA